MRLTDFRLNSHFSLVLKARLPKHLTQELQVKLGIGLRQPHCTALGVLFEQSEASHHVNLDICKLYTQLPRGVMTVS